MKIGGLIFVVSLAVALMRGGAVDLTSEAPARTRLFASGLGLQFANPNALVYFGAILPAYIDHSKPMALQVAIIMLPVSCTGRLGLWL